MICCWLVLYYDYHAIDDAAVSSLSSQSIVSFVMSVLLIQHGHDRKQAPLSSVVNKADDEAKQITNESHTPSLIWPTLSTTPGN